MMAYEGFESAWDEKNLVNLSTNSNLKLGHMSGCWKGS